MERKNTVGKNSSTHHPHPRFHASPRATARSLLYAADMQKFAYPVLSLFLLSGIACSTSNAAGPNATPETESAGPTADPETDRAGPNTKPETDTAGPDG